MNTSDDKTKAQPPEDSSVLDDEAMEKAVGGTKHTDDPPGAPGSSENQKYWDSYDKGRGFGE